MPSPFRVAEDVSDRHRRRVFCCNLMSSDVDCGPPSSKAVPPSRCHVETAHPQKALATAVACERLVARWRERNPSGLTMLLCQARGSLPVETSDPGASRLPLSFDKKGNLRSMVKTRTALILGAGASFAYGFPLGQQLKLQIVNELASSEPHSVAAIVARHPALQWRQSRVFDWPWRTRVQLLSTPSLRNRRDLRLDRSMRNGSSASETGIR